VTASVRGKDSGASLSPHVARPTTCVMSPPERRGVATGETNMSRSTLRFGSFEVDLESREIRKQGMRIRLEEKPFQILELLLQQAGQLVTRRALREKLWPETFVGYEHCLNTAINKLRELLGDSAQSSRFIETVPRRGYRFVLPVETFAGANSAAGKKMMLLVLPFRNLEANPEDDRFSNGLTEELITRLGRFEPEQLGVIARTTALYYEQRGSSIDQMGRDLSVDHVLEGSVRRDGSRVRIAAQLSQVSDQTQVWAESYERHLEDVFAIQIEVAESIARSLTIEFSLGRRTDDSETRCFPVSAATRWRRAG
jgi:TolB-like protein